MNKPILINTPEKLLEVYGKDSSEVTAEDLEKEQAWFPPASLNRGIGIVRAKQPRHCYE